MDCQKIISAWSMFWAEAEPPKPLTAAASKSTYRKDLLEAAIVHPRHAAVARYCQLNGAAQRPPWSYTLRRAGSSFLPDGCRVNRPNAGRLRLASPAPAASVQA